MTQHTLTTYLKQNPRAMGILFAMLLLLTEASNALAANGSTTTGP